MQATAERHTRFVKQAAAKLGFNFCGIAKAGFLEDDARRLNDWLANGYQGGMNYMENYFDIRVDPRKLVPGARSVISLLINYFPPVLQRDDAPKVSKYAYGKDYHDVIRKKLNEFFAALKLEAGDIAGRGFVDSAPVLERSWAQKSGLGWVGKNGNLINTKKGSFFFIASIITDLELIPDAPVVKDFCGTCTRCIDHCPTDAILPNRVVDGSKCISYFTIELKDAIIDPAMKGKFGNRVFGCDVCQDVCPWNSFSEPHNESAFEALPAVLGYSAADWYDLTEETFRTAFKDSPVKRSKFAGIRRNLKFIAADEQSN